MHDRKSKNELLHSDITSGFQNLDMFVTVMDFGLVLLFIGKGKFRNRMAIIDWMTHVIIKRFTSPLIVKCDLATYLVIAFTVCLVSFSFLIYSPR